MRQRVSTLAFLALLAGCHASADEDAAAAAASLNFQPPTADVKPPPVRVIDNSVLRELAAGKTPGVFLFDLRRVPVALRPDVIAERAEALACTGRVGSDAVAACARREQLIGELKRRGLCWGPDAEMEAERRWMHRGAGCRG